MAANSKIAKELEQLERQIRTSGKNLKESLKKTENLGAAIQAERSHQYGKNRRKMK